MFAPAADSVAVQLSSDYAVNAALGVWSHALLNTNLFALNTKPGWFDRVAADLAAAKTTTQPWLTTDYPAVASGLPQSLIDYGTLFIRAADELIPLFKNAPSDDDRATAVDIIDELKARATTQQFRVKGLQKKVETFAAFVIDTAAKFAKDRDDVMATFQGVNENLIKIQSRVTALYRELGVTETEAKNEMASAAMKGLSIAGSLFVYTISAAVIGSASAPIMSVGIGIIALTFAAIQEKAKTDSILSKLREIGELQAKVPVEQQQAASLQAVVASLETVSDLMRSAQANIAGSVHYWDDITSGLALAREILDQKQIDPRAITPFTKIADAQATWRKIVEAARNVQRSVFQVHPAVAIDGAAA